MTTTKDMLIIRDAGGDVIVAQSLEAESTGYTVFIKPADDHHTLHRVSDVPAHIHDMTHPGEFQKAINDYVKSSGAKLTDVTLEELHAQSAVTPNAP